MKIQPNNIPVYKNLDFRLKLNIQADKNKGSFKSWKWVTTTNGITIQDSIDDSEKGLDIDFEIERTDGEEPSVAKITIWNLSNSTFNEISSKGNVFELYFARGSDDWGLLFKGTPYFSTQEDAQGGNNNSRGFLKKEDQTAGQNDIATNIVLIDSLHAFETATISKSYQGTVDIGLIIKDCAKAMGVVIGDEPEQYKTINNYVARGSCSKVLNELCGKMQCKHIIDNGVLHIYKEKKPKVFGYLFNADNSSRPLPELDDDVTLYHFETKLLTNLRAGQYCKCDFATLSGTRQIVKILLVGNNYGTSGHTEIWVK